MLDLASVNSKSNTKVVEMDSCDIEYDDEIFDPFVDTFGLQCSYDPLKQYSEMKRVCKVKLNSNKKRKAGWFY